MTQMFSVYLDLVRFFAACLVVIYHSRNPQIVTEALPLSGYGHESVIVFFVLSGYVIAYVSDAKERDFIAYWSSRLARVYSLAIPAVVLTVFLDNIGEELHPAFYEGKTTHDYWYVRILSSWLFLNETWGASIMSFSNVPYWSLCYEMWYYVLFSLYIHFSGRRRTWLLVLAAFLVGPKILLLAPLWILGVVIYRWQSPYSIPEWLAWAMFVASLLLVHFFLSLDLTYRLSEELRLVVGDELHKQLTFSKFFLGDYLLGLIIFCNFIGARRIAQRVRDIPRRATRVIRSASDFTFSIYILHQPLILFFAAVVFAEPEGYGSYLEVMALTAAAIVIVGGFFERRRFALRNWLRETLQRAAGSRLWRERLLPMLAKALPV